MQSFLSSGGFGAPSCFFAPRFGGLGRGRSQSVGRSVLLGGAFGLSRPFACFGVFLGDCYRFGFPHPQLQVCCAEGLLQQPPFRLSRNRDCHICQQLFRSNGFLRASSFASLASLASASAAIAMALDAKYASHLQCQ